MTLASDTATMSPRPATSSSVLTSALLSFAKCFGAREASEVYLSAPITTGEAYVTWRRGHGAEIARDHPRYESLHYQHVISTNINRVGSLVARLRKEYSDRLVIDPTSLANINGWAQDDYHAFWCSLIERYIETIVFADGWEYSTGCVHEFATALRTRKEILTQALRPLDHRVGIRMIAAAVAKFESLDVDASSLHRALNSAENAIKDC